MHQSFGVFESATLLPYWLWILCFLFLVEEKELLEKLGEEYSVYRQKVPMLLANPVCLYWVLSNPVESPEGVV
jgi:protein-S-isoprenylcysteine O-methyltransferase Ste14